MSSTAECIAAIKAEDFSKFASLITKNTHDWKRVNKFNYRNGIRRYFYLVDSCLIATVDSVAGRLYTIVRPPMLWELYMLMELRPNDQFLHEEAYELFEEHYDFVITEASKGSEAQQYYFQIGEEEDEGVWVFFNPIHYKDVFDQHLGGDLYDILPEWLRENEEAECAYSAFGSEDKTIDEIKKELVDLGFEYSDEEM